MRAFIKKNTAIRAAILLILSCQFFVSGCKKEPKEKTGNIEGVITNAFNQPIEKAKVVLSGMNYEQIVVSTVEGKYNLNYISAGQYQMNVSKDGYLTASRSIEVLAEQQNIQNFTLEAGAESLEISQDTLVMFGANGYGIVLLFAHGSSAQRWKVIESTKNDSVYIHPQSEFAFSNWIFDEVYINYDHSKILLYPAESGLRKASIILTL